MENSKYEAAAQAMSEIAVTYGTEPAEYGDCATGSHRLPTPLTREEEITELVNEMWDVAHSPEEDAFAEYVAQNKQTIREAASFDQNVAKMLERCYGVGIARGSATCMNDLGALYYMGDMVEQDYARAAELYEMAMNNGCTQSIINMGYIWEYGRTGTRDFAKAFECYALAASLASSSEATYKLGDMYARGKFVQRDMAKAYWLWTRSMDLSENIVQVAHPALRIAQLLVSEDCEEAHAEPDALRALNLFQQAEVGLRIDINEGQTYYVEQLQKAIAGQEVARALLDGGPAGTICNS